MLLWSDVVLLLTMLYLFPRTLPDCNRREEWQQENNWWICCLTLSAPLLFVIIPPISLALPRLKKKIHRAHFSAGQFVLKWKWVNIICCFSLFMCSHFCCCYVVARKTHMGRTLNKYEYGHRIWINGFKNGIWISVMWNMIYLFGNDSLNWNRI